MNKWQKAITELLTVYKTSASLAASINKMLDADNQITGGHINRVLVGTTRRMEHELGQALLILHVKSYTSGSESVDSEPSPGRDSMIVEQRDKGKTYTEIGEFFGLSRQRVEQIYKKYRPTGAANDSN